jgi:hypothetical protein
MVDFDKAFRKKGGKSLDDMWAIISAIGLWANVEDVSELISEQLLRDITDSTDDRLQTAMTVTRHAS